MYVCSMVVFLLYMNSCLELCTNLGYPYYCWACSLFVKLFFLWCFFFHPMSCVHFLSDALTVLARICAIFSLPFWRSAKRFRVVNIFLYISCNKSIIILATSRPCLRPLFMGVFLGALKFKQTAVLSNYAAQWKRISSGPGLCGGKSAVRTALYRFMWRHLHLRRPQLYALHSFNCSAGRTELWDYTERFCFGKRMLS